MSGVAILDIILELKSKGEELAEEDTEVGPPEVGLARLLLPYCSLLCFCSRMILVRNSSISLNSLDVLAILVCSEVNTLLACSKEFLLKMY